MLGLSLELGLEVLEEGVVEVLTTEMGVSSGGLDGEDLTLDGKKGDIESSTSEIEDEDSSLVGGLFIETVSNGGSSGLVDDSENLESGDGTGILGSETLGVVEVSGDAASQYKSFIGDDWTYVTTAFLTVLPSLASEISFILMRTMEEISWGEKDFLSPR